MAQAAEYEWSEHFSPAGAAAQAAMNQQTEQIAHSVFKMNTKVADKGEYVLLFVPEGSQVRVRCPSFVSPRDRS